MNERQLRWDRRYQELARQVGQWSKDPSTKVGAILVRPNNSIASTGYNGFPPGADDSPELYQNREYKYQHVIHAEVNALNFHGDAAPGYSLYTSFPCCPDCVVFAGHRGVTRIIEPALPILGRNEEWISEWNQRMNASRVIAEGFNIALETFDV